MTKEEIYKEYSANPIEWMKNNNCVTSRDISLKMMGIAQEQIKKDVIESHVCKFQVNSNWTGYSRCDCGKKHESSVFDSVSKSVKYSNCPKCKVKRLITYIDGKECSSCNYVC